MQTIPFSGGVALPIAESDVTGLVSDLASKQDASTAATDAELAAAVAGLQPLDSDLTAIAALSTTAFGRSLLALADAAAARTAIGAAPSSHGHAESEITGLVADLAGKQPLDSDLTAIAALSTTTFGRSLLTLADAAAGRSSLGLVIGTNVQAYDTDLDAIAALSTTATGRSLLAAADAAAIRTISEANRAIDTGEATLATTYSFTGTLADVGVSLGSLAAGTYLFTLDGAASISNAAGQTTFVSVVLNIGGTDQSPSALAYLGMTGNAYIPVVRRWKATLGSSQTVKLRGNKSSLATVGSASLNDTFGPVKLQYERIA